MDEDSDLVTHMRELAEDLHSVYGISEIGSTLDRAADEIERLRAEASNNDG